MSSATTVQILPCRAGLSQEWTFTPAEVVSITPGTVRLVSTIPLQSGETFLLRIKQVGGAGGGAGGAYGSCATTSIAYTVTDRMLRTGIHRSDGKTGYTIDARFEGFVANPRNIDARALAFHRTALSPEGFALSQRDVIARRFGQPPLQPFPSRHGPAPSSVRN